MPFNLFTNPASQLALFLMMLGLVGSVVPVLPGAILVWFGALAWAIGENFQRLNWPTLIVMGIIAIVATFSEYWLAPLTQKQSGFGWKNVVVAMVGGIAGGILLSEVPIIGTLFGAAVGSVVGVSVFTFWQRRNFRDAMRAGQAYLTGCALSALVEVTASLLMIAIFAWRVFF